MGAPVKKGARAVPAGLDTLDGGGYRAHRRKCGCHRSRRPSAPTLPRRSRDRGAPRTVRPTGWRASNALAYDVMCAVPSRLTKGARAVPAILHTLDGGSYRAHRRKHGCNRSRQPSAPTLPRQSRNRGAPRTVRPTGRQRNERCGIQRNGCDKLYLTASLKHTLSHIP